MRKRNTGKALHAGTWLVSLFLALSVCMPAVPVMAEEAEEQPAVQEEIPDEAEAAGEEAPEETETVSEDPAEETTEEVSSETEDVFSEQEEAVPAQQEEEPVQTEEDKPEETVVLETETEEEAAEADPEEMSSWAALQKKIELSSEGETIVLEDDVIASSSDTAGLFIAAGKDIVIDLNGKTISRNLSEAIREGYVFQVKGSLKIINSGAQADGVITGANNEWTGGAFLNEGTLILENVTVKDNYSQQGGALYSSGSAEFKDCVFSGNHTAYDGGALSFSGGTAVMTNCQVSGNYADGLKGGGINVQHKCVLNMSDCRILDNYVTTVTGSGGGINIYDSTVNIDGGEISGNTATHGGGIHYDGTLTLANDPVISGNTSTYYQGSDGADILVYEDVLIQFSGELTEDAKIGVEAFYPPSDREPEPIVVTSGLKGNGSIRNFTCPNTENALGLNYDGEIVVGIPRTVRFLAGGGEGQMADVKGAYHSLFLLPECSFTPPAGKTFVGWQTAEGIKNPGELISLNDNISVTAAWSSSRWEHIQDLINAAESDATITLGYDITAPAGIGPLTIPSGKSITLDLNGHTIDRALEEPTENGSVILAQGGLTIIDGGGGGEIKGGNTTGNGGGILATTSVDIYGGTITGNHADLSGGGAYGSAVVSVRGASITGNDAGQYGGAAAAERAVTIVGSEITNNTAGVRGGGIYGADKIVVVDGMSTIIGNTVGSKAENIWFAGGNYVKMLASGSFHEDTRIGITMTETPEDGAPVILSPVLNGRGTAKNFVSDNEEYGVSLNDEGRAVLVIPLTVIFLPGTDGDAGSMEPDTAGKGINYTLPECGFDLKGAMFAGWLVDDETEVRQPGDKVLAKENLTLTAVWDNTPWKHLQSLIDHAEDGEVITLDQEVIASAADKALTVPAGKNVIIDLNGFEINRNLSEPVKNGYVINVEGKLTIRDSGTDGKITGGKNNSTPTTGEGAGGIQIASDGELILESGTITGNYALGGAGIACLGKLTMTGGSIQGNTARAFGGAVDLNYGEMNFSGGEISGNSAGARAGGIYCLHSNLRVSGSPVIKGNTAGNVPSNVYIQEDDKIEVSGVLNADADIHVSSYVLEDQGSSVIITAGMPEKGSVDNFTSDLGAYAPGYNADGEIILGTARTIHFLDSTGQAGTAMPDVKRADGSVYTLPECRFKKPDKVMKFRGWLKDGDTENYLQPGETFVITKDVVLKAAWIDLWADLQRQIDETEISVNYKLEEDLVAGRADGPLTIPEGKILMIDLNGHAINRNLDAPEVEGSVFVNKGFLTISDSSEEKTGVITGGYEDDYGGAIRNYGRVLLNSGTISGNHAGTHGGAVYNTAQFTMKDGLITGNEAENGCGGGVWQKDGASGVWFAFIGGEISGNKAGTSGGGLYGSSGITVGGRVTVKNNTVNGKENNLYISADTVVDIDSKLTDDSLIGITAEAQTGYGRAFVITRGLASRGSLSNLFSDDPERILILSSEDEAQIASAAAVTFESGHEDAAGTMEDAKAPLGLDYTVPECGFSVSGKSFDGWMLNDDPEQVLTPGSVITAEGDMKLTALWGGSWAALQKQINESASGDVIVLQDHVTAAVADGPLTVAKGKKVTIDLNGFEINRNLKEIADNGAVFLIRGNLTIMDSSDEQSGLITGGNNNAATPEYCGTVNITNGTFTLDGGTISGNYSYMGGGIFVSGGTFTMNGGTIENNSANRCSAVLLYNNGTMNLNGGTIKDNSCRSGSAIETSGGTLNISGSPEVSGNTSNGNVRNVMIANKLINVKGPLTEEAKIGVTYPYGTDPYIFTTGLKGNGTAANFTSDLTSLVVSQNADGEAVIGAMCTISFLNDQGEHESGMPDIIHAKGSTFLVPECSFVKPADNMALKGWIKNGDTSEYIQPGTVLTISEDTVFQAEWLNLWEDLQQKINEADTTLNFKLETDIRACKDDTSLVIGEDKIVMLDLNGFTLSRELEEPEEGGSVLVNNGFLTISDSSKDQTGMITGGYSSDNGGGILNNGRVMLKSGNITGNKAANDGGGIYNTNKFTMQGGTISGNEAVSGSGGGVYQLDQESGSGIWTALTGGEISGNKAKTNGGGLIGSGKIVLYGEVTVKDNTVNEKENNLFVSSGKPVSINQTLVESTSVGITTKDSPEYGQGVVFTHGFSGKGTVDNFFSDDPERIVILNDAGEAQLASAVTVTFESGSDEASGEMEDDKAPFGFGYKIPECGFAVEGKSFNGWAFNGDPEQVLQPGTTITVAGDMTLTALWSGSWSALQKQINEAEAGDVIVLQEDAVAAFSDGPLTVPAGKDITIDLNGFEINRNLKEAADNGAAFLVKGSLTIKDTSWNKAGLITGSNNSAASPTASGTINVYNGSFTLESGTISGNYSELAGAVYVTGSTFTMNGGSIKSNTAKRCAAVMLYSNAVMNMNGGVITENTSSSGNAVETVTGTLHISGSPVIIGNTRGGNERNVLVANNKIKVTGPLSDDASIGITTSGGDNPIVLTEGLKGNGTAARFVSDVSGYAIILNEDGEAVMGKFSVPEFSGHQLVLSGTLGLRFGVKLPEGFDETGSYVTFTVHGEEQRVDTDQAETLEDGRKVFTCYVNTLQMAEKIQAVFHYEDVQTVEHTYSLEDYFSYFDEHESDFNEKTLNLVHAVANYGYFAYPYLVQIHHLEGKYAPITKYYDTSFDIEEIKQKVAQYTFAKGISDSDVSAASYKLSLDSDTALSVMVKVPAGTEVSASTAFNGEIYHMVQESDTVWSVKIPGIKASQLGDTITVSGTAGGDFTISVSALSYVRSVLNSDKYKGDAQNAVMALYKYYEAVMASR